MILSKMGMRKRMRRGYMDLYLAKTGYMILSKMGMRRGFMDLYLAKTGYIILSKMGIRKRMRRG